MIGKNLHHDVNVNNLDRAKLISDKRKALDQASSQIQQEIFHCFKRLEEVLKTRERRLIQQLEAVHRQQLSLIQSNFELLPSIPLITLNLNKENELEKQILAFGQIELSDDCITINDSKPHRVVDYQEAHKDHINFDKSLYTEKIDLYKKHDLCLKTPLNLNISTLQTNIDISKKENEPSSIIRLEPEESDQKHVGRVSNSLSEEMELVGSYSNFNILNKNMNMCTTEINAQTEQLKLKDSDLYMRTHTVLENTCTKNMENDTDLQDKVKNDNKDEIMTINRNGQDSSKYESEHPKQVQQWLQQILVETETEPVVHEIGDFSGVPHSEICTEFPLEI